MNNHEALQVIHDVYKTDGLLWQTEGALDAVVNRACQAQYVLLGKSTHGTAQYYEVMADVSKRLILEGGYKFIAIDR